MTLASKIVVINLPERLDRRARMMRVAEEENLDLVFSNGCRVPFSEVSEEEVSAVNWSDKKGLDHQLYASALVGCKRAHLRVIQEALAENTQSLLILEDDVAFRNGWREIFQAAVKSLPSGWLQLYLSGFSFKPPEKVWLHLVRLTAAWQTTAILYSREGMLAALECLTSARCEIDHWFALNLHSIGRSYMINPEITYQIAGYSDCRGCLRGELH